MCVIIVQNKIIDFHIDKIPILFLIMIEIITFTMAKKIQHTGRFTFTLIEVLFTHVQKQKLTLALESEVLRIGGKIIIHLRVLGKARFSFLCDVIFLRMMRLQGKFEIDHSWERIFKSIFISFIRLVIKLNECPASSKEVLRGGSVIPCQQSAYAIAADRIILH